MTVVGWRDLQRRRRRVGKRSISGRRPRPSPQTTSSKADDPLRVWPLNLAKFSSPSSSMGKLQQINLTRWSRCKSSEFAIKSVGMEESWQISRQQMIRSDIAFLDRAQPDGRDVKSPYRARVHPDPSISPRRGSTSCGVACKRARTRNNNFVYPPPYDGGK